ncbi:glucose 1-dehydrogenase [Maricurvus nonylphenolicus]|uniref:glucose 1-dehydrogenase n=1 Tax=Maricurvus nonylphenolicus TaxID=1008307 RepID=UPI0036F2EA4B
MTKRLEGKVALVTGAGSGIGEAVSKRLAEEGAVVYVSDINLEGAQRVAADISEAGGKAVAKQQDVTNADRWQQVITEIVAEQGGLQVLVNNAGIVIPGSVADCSLADWKTTQAVNGESVFMGTQSAIDAMKDSGGSIINISSIEGIVGEPQAAAYNYSKGGVRIFTKSAALHCASQGYPVRINSVHPGFIETPLIAGAAASLSEAEAIEMLERIQAAIPMGHMGQPEDIANGCLFLASDESRYMTGSELVIDGGYTAR